MTISLGFLPNLVFGFLLIFARVGTMLMLLPGLGEATIPARFRLVFALAFAFVLFPLLSANLPVIPQGFPQLVTYLLHEVAVGLILGAMTRIFVSAAQTAGAVIAFQTGLSTAQAADPSNEGVQGAVVGNFLSVLGIALIFATDLHHLALSAVFDSYRLISPTDPLMLDDAGQMAIRAVSAAFSVGVQMSAPFIVFGLIVNLGFGILGRLMPQLQVYFVGMPATIGVGLVLLAILLTMMMGLYLTHVEAQLTMLRG